MHAHFDEIAPNYKHIVGFAAVSIFINMLVMYESTSNVKKSFLQKHQITKQKDDFEAILSSFPEGIMIARTAKDDKQLASPRPDLQDVSLENSQIENLPLEANQIVLPDIRFANKVLR